MSAFLTGPFLPQRRLRVLAGTQVEWAAQRGAVNQ